MGKKERSLAYIPLVAALAGSAIPSAEAYAQTRAAPDSTKTICLYGPDSKWTLNSEARWGAVKDGCTSYTSLNTTVRDYPFPLYTPAQQQTSQPQQQTRAQQIRNTIFSKCPEYSVSGDGILLKNFVFNESGSSDNVKEVISCLYAQKGDLDYDTLNLERGLANVLSVLRSGPKTPEKRASIAYLQGLSGTAPEDTYMLIARSPAIEGYNAQSIALLVNKDGAAGQEPGVPRGLRPVRDPEEARPPRGRRDIGIEPTVSPIEGDTSRAGQREYYDIKVGEKADTLVLTVPYEKLTPAQRRRVNEAVRGWKKVSPNVYVFNKEKRKTDHFGLGLEFLAGTNKELAAGGYFKFGFAPSFAVELGANYAFRQEGPYFLGETNEVTQREDVLVGPGTYHTRTDSIATTTNRKGIAEAGARVVISPTEWLDFFVGGGVRPSDKTTNVYGQSIIGLERNQQLIRADTLENTLTERSFVYPAFAQGGARFEPLKHVNISVLYEMGGKQKVLKVGAGVNF